MEKSPALDTSSSTMNTEDLMNERNKLNHKQVELKTKRIALVTLLKMMYYWLYLPT
jgi:hypothetical protein